MSEFNIEVQGGSSVRLPTGGKYCDRDIIVTASGGGGTEEIENLIDQSGVLGTTDETVTVTEKVEQLIDKGNIENFYYQRTSIIDSASGWFLDFKGIKLPRSNFVKATKVTEFARNSTITDVDYYLNWGAESTAIINATNAFSNTVNLTHMVGVKTDKCYNMANFFKGSAIEEVDEPFNLSSITQSSYLKDAFGCSKLREIRFEKNSIKWSITFTSAELSDDSIESILKGLAPVETEQTLTVHMDVYNKMLGDEFFDLVSEAIDKGWNIGY